MKIADSQLAFSTRHFAAQEKQTYESFKLSAGGKSSSPSPSVPGAAAPGTDGADVRISDMGRQLAQENGLNMTHGARPAGEINRQTDNDPKLSLLRLAVEMLTGKKAEIGDTSSKDPKEAAAGGVSLEYQRHSSYTEIEQTDFAAEGVVRTADGREISFQMNLSMARAYHTEEHVEVSMGTKLKDPLVLNFAGTAAELSDMTFRFDLDSDGKDENLRALRPGSGFLVFDRNGDGKVNNGRELFGAVSGNGFGELAALDDDGNGWIDENDSAYGSLYVWNKGASGGDVLRSLRAARVGAIALANADTPFSVKDIDNQLLAQVRSTGVFLKEDGQAGSVQQIDLAV
ncbi:MAG: VCBS repeat-containing protein [Azoarcus sp.]|jgi:hypothetical protein|nr:VCBS repeat-containing protein [Azoarcus sp.]